MVKWVGIYFCFDGGWILLVRNDLCFQMQSKNVYLGVHEHVYKTGINQV